jgi:tetratricopeptide (TPR) repeat protein
MQNEVAIEADPVPRTAVRKNSARRNSWALRIAVAVAMPVLLIGLLEGSLRLFNVGFSTDVTIPCRVHGQPASCYNLFFPAPFFPPGMIKTPQAYAIPLAKPQGTYRIVVLGESAAMGDPDPAYGFSRYLEVMLRQRFPAMKFEMVNTGSVAINSHVSLLIAKGLAKQQPDAFIIYSGNNEVVGPYGPGTALTSSSMNLAVIRSSIFLRSTRTGQLLTRLGEQKQEWRGMEMFLDKQVRANSPLMPATYSNFEQNLRDTIAAARASGARVLVSTVATNLKDCAPFASLHREGLTQDQLNSWSALVQEGSDLENAKSYPEALRRYEAAAKIDDEYADLEFRTARVLWGMGDYPNAKQHYIRARNLDTLRFRADSRINDINRAVGSSTDGAELVDAEDVFSKQSSNGITGSELVYEHVHMTPEGNYLLARAMFLQLAGKLAAQKGGTLSEADVPSQPECDRLLALTSHDRLRISNEMLGRLQKPPFTNQINHSDQLLRLAIQTSAVDENPNDTAAEYQRAIQASPDDRILHYNFGLFLFDYDRNAAAEQLRMARPWDDFPVFAPDGTPIG